MSWTDRRPAARLVVLALFVAGASLLIGSPVAATAPSAPADTQMDRSRSPIPVTASQEAGNTLIGWGTDYTGAVGTGDTSPEAGNTAVTYPTPVAVTPALAGRTVTKVIANWNSGTCALASGDLVCWGSRRTATLDDTAGVLRPGSITDFDRTDEVTCVVADRKAYCRGANDRGQLGNNSLSGSNVFVPVWDKGVLAGRSVQAISVGGDGACALADGQVFCWGYNYYGQLGIGTSGAGTDSVVPVAVDTTGALKSLTVDQIGVGSRGACARAQQHVFCWGDETILGVDRADPLFRAVPGEIDTTGALAGRTITDLDVLGETACVLADGAPYCWGSGAPYWGIGTGNVVSYLPVAIQSPALSGKTATDLVVGGISCVLASGAPVCWGDNSSGGLGVGNSDRDFLPAATYTGGALAGRTITKLGGGGAQVAFAITAEPPGRATAAGTFTAIQPARVLDTRTVAGGRAAIPGGGQVDVQVAGVTGVPTDAGAVSINLTVTQPQGVGHLTAGASGAAPPPVSNLNFTRGQTVANLAVVKVGAGGRISIRNGSAAPAQIIADVTGYYLGGVASTPGSYQSVTPTRLLDTRNGTGAPSSPIRPGGTVAVPVDGRGGVPPNGASAAVLNLTATNPQALGHVTAYGTGTARPPTSNLNFTAGATVAALAVVPIGDDGTITLANGSAAGQVDLIADIVGYYLPGTSTAAGAFVPIEPTRLLDSRVGLRQNGPIPARGSATFEAAGNYGLPRWAAATAAVNLTVVGPPSAGYATIRPAATAGPATTSTLNFTPGLTVSNNAVAPGASRVLNGSPAPIDAVVDVFGYFHN